MQKLYCLLLVIAVLTMLGCSSNKKEFSAIHVPSSTIDNKMGDLYTTGASVRVLEVRKNKETTWDTSSNLRNTDYIICEMPPPDSALSKFTSEVTDVFSRSKSPDGSEESKGLTKEEEFALVAMEMAGRTQVVLLAREFLASNCRAVANGWTTVEQFNKMQQEVLDTMRQMVTSSKAQEAKATGEAEKGKIQEEILKTEAEKGRIQAEILKIETEKNKIEAEKGRIQEEIKLESLNQQRE